LRTYIYLITALCCLIVTIALSFFYRNTVPLEVYLEEVQENLETELLVAQQQTTTLKQQLLTQQKIHFENLPLDSKYPIFVYQNEQLRYWTSNKFMIDNESLTGKFKVQGVQNNYGNFLVVKETILLKGNRYRLAIAIPLSLEPEDNQYLTLKINEEIFQNAQLRGISLNSDDGYTVNLEDGRFLCAIMTAPDTDKIQLKSTGIYGNLILFFASLTLIFTFLQIRLNLKEYIHRRKVSEGFLILLVSLAGIRAVMLKLNLPFNLVPYDLFNFKYYASSDISPSLGDLFLNMLSICFLVGFVYFNYYRLFNYRKLLQLPQKQKKMIAVILGLVTFVSFYFLFLVLESIYFNSQTTLDITSDINFNIFKITCFLIFILSALIYFFTCHIVGRLLLLIHHSMRQLGQNLLISSVIFLLIMSILDRFDAMVFFLNLVYIGGISFGRMPKMVRSFSYDTYLYIFFNVLISAMIGAYSIYIFEKTMDGRMKRSFANRLLIENDEQGEFLLDKALTDIRKDPMIKNRLMSSFSSKDLIIQKIKRSHLKSYFDKYDISVLIFNAQGRPYNYDRDYYTLFDRYAIPDYETDYKSIYFIKDMPDNAKRYLIFIEIERRGVALGKVILDLRLKKIIPNSVYPTLFLTQNDFPNIYDDSDISYGIFKNGEFAYGKGDFNYDKELLQKLHKKQSDSTQQEKELEIGTYRHLLIKGENNREIIITSSFSPAQSIASNFSFLFIILFIFMLFSATTYTAFSRRKQLKLNLSARIQVYLNLAFSLPLFALSILIISNLNSTNRNSTKDEYLQRAENISTNIVKDLEKYNKSLISHEELLELIVTVHKITQTDINLFDNQGFLLASNQPFIYDSDLLAKLINPQAMTHIAEKSQNKVMLSEEVGSVKYSSAYVAIRSYETGELLGIVGTPFFESQKESEQEIIQIISTIINVFTFVFISLMLLSYFASRVLTGSLRMITQKINLTTLDYNEPIDYKSEDEIGVLVKAYNNMLRQLEASKQALSRNEKESAWREMARQVAHEIKNPLTPMKLTLQHLQRVLSVENPRAGERVSMLLTQIETLSDIASSFSAFAKMPIPKNEKFDVADTLRQTVLLYRNDTKVKIEPDILIGKAFVMGDQKLTGRIFTNLILNGIQAVPHERQPEIVILMTKPDDQRILIEIRDNGAGIEEEIRYKVFIPNFSTKYTGSGIGLALAKRGITNSGGKIWFETEMNIGTSFFIELPLLEYVD